MIKKYADFDVQNENIHFNFMSKQYHDFLGKKSEIIKHTETENEDVTFGLIKSLWKDAVDYKKKRDMLKGGYKAIHRIIPIAGAFIFFPLWVVGTIFGVSRAFNKIIEPIMQDPTNHYNGFIKKFLHNLIEFTEGDIRHLIGEDWFYDAFMISDDIVKMLRKEVVLEFVKDLTDKMELEPDDKIVPDYYVENELRSFLNKEYNLNPGLPFKS